MYRRVITLCLSGIALATTAYAASNFSSWSVQSTVMSPGSATISPAPVTTITKSGRTIGYSAAITTTSASYTVTSATGYSLKSVLVDGRSVNIKNGNPNYPSSFTYTFNNDRGVHNLNVNTAANKYDFTLVKTNNGDGNASGGFSPSSVKNVTYGAQKTITIIPAKGSIITNVTDSGGATPKYFIGNTNTQVQNWSDVNSGQSVKVVYTVDGPHTLTASFGKIRGATAAILKSYPTTPLNMTGTPAQVVVGLDGRPSTTKSGSITYAWSASPATGCSFSAGTSAKTNVTFTKAGTYVVSLVVSDGTVASTPATVSFTVNSQAVTDSGPCVKCHNPATVVAPYTASDHATSNAVTCSGCHGDHATGITSVTYNTTKCSNCHSNDSSDFQASKHWNSSFEYGPEFAGGAVAGQIDPNNSYTTTEDGVLTTCAYRCHFKPGMGPSSDIAGLLADGHSTTNVTYTDTLNSKTYSRPGGDGCMACHDAHGLTATYQSTCLTCHSGSKHGVMPKAFFNSKHWKNDFETSSDFKGQIDTQVQNGDVKNLGTTTDGYLNPNDSYATTEAGALVTCAYRCHFRPGMGPNADVAGYLANRHSTTYVAYNDTLNNKTYSRPGGDACMACHSAHGLEANYQSTCLTCHTGSKHGVAPNAFFASKHWNSSFEAGSEFANQMDTTVAGGNVKNLGTFSNGVLNPNDSYTTTEDGAVVTCAYRCHFRPGMGPNSDVPGYLAGGKSTTYVTYSSPYGGKYSRPGGDACMACHDAHGLDATAQSTCYTCHTGGKHGWSVAAFEKSTHFTSPYAIADGIGGPTGKACVACHDPHSLAAPFFAMSTATQIKKGVGCQSCHTPGASYAVYNADGTGKAPHFATTPNSWDTTATAYYTGTGAACSECHSHNNTINAGWAEGGHGDITAVPWKGDSGHKDWGAQGSNGVSYQSSPQATNCIRCHSAKGFAAFVDSGFTKIDKLPASELAAPLTCSACHDSVDKGTLRLANFTTASKGAKGFKAYWGYSSATFVDRTKTASGTSRVVTAIQLGDNRNSNICMPCHSQRASGQEIKDVFAAAKPAIAPGVAGSGLGTAIYPHGAQPAAIFYGKGGYDFTATNGTGSSNGFAYQDRARHQRIGNYLPSGYNDTGVTQGSCVGCHMTSDKTHNLEVVTKDSNGNLTGIVSTECAKCHPTQFTYQDLQAKKDELAALAKALGNLLVKKGITLDGVNPLPERTSNFDMSLGTGDLVKAEKNTGAWFNWYLFSTADPGAYAHNPSYARRLLTDSIDWMDDNSLNSSAANTVLAMGVNGNALYNANVDVSKAIAYTNDPGCLGCHFGSGTNSNSAPGIESAPHYNTAGTLVPGQSFTQAQFVVPGAQCNNCHGYGHGTDSPSSTVLNQYGESAHADVKGLAWTDYDFKTRPTCNACHTTQGFVTAIGNNWTNTAAFGIAGDNAKQVLGCNTCHSSTAWKSYSTASGKLASSIRVISGGYTAGMGGYGSAAKATAKFSDQGESNICMPCHATRENGDSLMAGTGTIASPVSYDFTNKSFVNPHYLGSAAVWQGVAGFRFYTSTARYAVNKPTHGVATPDIQTPNHSFNSRMSAQQQQKGSCVACHMGLTNSHTFDTYSTATRYQFNTGAQVTGCLGCHNNTNGGKDRYYQTSNPSSGGYALDRTIDFLTWQFAQLGIYFNNNGAGGNYFFTNPGNTTVVTNWTTQVANLDNVGSQTAQQLGLQTMGAAMNLKILATDHGAAAHNAAWTKAVAADSLVFLQHGNVGDRKSTAAINNISFTAYSTAITPVGGGLPKDGKPCSISNLKSFLTSGGLRK